MIDAILPDREVTTEKWKSVSEIKLHSVFTCGPQRATRIRQDLPFYSKSAAPYSFIPLTMSSLGSALEKIKNIFQQSKYCTFCKKDVQIKGPYGWNKHKKTCTLRSRGQDEAIESGDDGFPAAAGDGGARDPASPAPGTSIQHPSTSHSQQTPSKISLLKRAAQVDEENARKSKQARIGLLLKSQYKDGSVSFPPKAFRVPQY